MKEMKSVKSILILLLAVVLSFGVIVTNVVFAGDTGEPEEEPTEEKITVYVFGNPTLYKKDIGVGPDEDWAVIKTIKASPDQTYGDIESQVLEGLVLGTGFVGWKHTLITKNRGSLAVNDQWKKDMVLGDHVIKEGDFKGSVRIYIAYQMRFVTAYNTQNADNDSDFDYYTSEVYEADSKLPDQEPIRKTTEVGRDDHKFLGWYKESDYINEIKDKVIDNIKPIWKDQGGQYVEIDNPKYKEDDQLYTERYKIKQVTFYAKWNEAPLLKLTDVEIEEGSEFDPKSMVLSATDKEDGEDLIKDVEVSGDYDIAKPGTYSLTFTLTDEGGLKHTAKANLTVKAKEQPSETTPDPSETTPDPSETAPDPSETTPDPSETTTEPTESETEESKPTEATEKPTEPKATETIAPSQTTATTTSGQAGATKTGESQGPLWIALLVLAAGALFFFVRKGVQHKS